MITVVKDRHEGRDTKRIEAVVAEDQVAYMLALTESTEFGDIVETLAASDPASLKAKLNDVLRGPLLPVDEDPSRGNKSRNTLFELNAAAFLKRAGFEPTPGEHPDLKVVVDGRTIALE